MGKQETLARIFKAVRDKFGDSAAVRLSESASRSEVADVIPTGIAVLDQHVFGCGGIPVGRVIELFSEEGQGKTALAYQFLAAAQRDGSVAMLIETEHGLSEERLRTYGVDLADLLLMEPDTMEGLLEQLEVALEAVPHQHKGSVLVAWDSLASVPTKKEVEEGLEGHEKMGERARVMSHAMRVISSLLLKKRAALVIVNHLKTKLGVMYGDSTTTPGGAAVKFHASLRLRLYSGKSDKDDDGGHAGKLVTVQAVKNRFAPPFRKASVKLDFAKGWDDAWSTVNHAKDRKLIPDSARGEKAHAEALAALGWPVRGKKES